MCGRNSVGNPARQVCMPLNGKVQCIDECIHHIVAALNAGGVGTVASCCGHGGDPLDHGRIDLEDCRVLVVMTQDQYARFAQEGSQNG